jgi:acetolactate synthase-1/2/3 large subunit
MRLQFLCYTKRELSHHDIIHLWTQMGIQFNTADASDNIILISGAGDGTTGGGLCAFDGESVKVIDRVSTAGITVFEGRLARLLRTPYATGGGEILLYDSRGVSQYFRIDHLSDAHYMAWDGQNLIVSSTGTNSLVWITLSGNIVHEWRAPGEGDSWHLNDVCFYKDNVYASAFGRYANYRGYKDHLDEGDGFIFDVASGHVVASGFRAPHSPRWFDGAWTVCDSLRQAVVQIDGESGSERRRAKLKAFTRGLAITDDYLVVGESAHRKAGGELSGSLAILRRADLGFVFRLELPFPEVAEVAVAPRSLLHATRTGFRTNLLRISESDQLQMFRDVGLEPKRLWGVSDPLTAAQCRVTIDAAIPTSFVSGQLMRVKCTVTNLGDGFMNSQLPHPVHVSYRWSAIPGSPPPPHVEGLRTKLPGTLPPCSSMEFDVEVLPPEMEGRFELMMTLVQEGVAWFHDIDVTNGCSAVVDVFINSNWR